MGTHDRLLVLSESEEIWDPEGYVFVSDRFITPFIFIKGTL